MPASLAEEEKAYVLWVGGLHLPGITQDHPGSRDSDPRRASVEDFCHLGILAVAKTMGIYGVAQHDFPHQIYMVRPIRMQRDLFIVTSDRQRH